MFDSKIRILVVDDMITMRKFVSKFLKELGYTDITEASDGQVAWEKLSESKFDLVISDWNMPVKTGIDLLKLIRTNGTTKNLPFIMVTAEGEERQVQEAASYNVDEYILKPFAKEKLAKALEDVSAKKKSAA